MKRNIVLILGRNKKLGENIGKVKTLTHNQGVPGSNPGGPTK